MIIAGIKIFKAEVAENTRSKKRKISGIVDDVKILPL